MNRYFSIILTALSLGFAVHADNWLLGDCDCESEIKNITSGPWTNHNEAVPKMRWDSQTGYQSKSSLYVYNYGAIGMQTLTLPKGKYIFSAWIKSKPQTRVTLTVVKRDINWYILAEEREKNLIYPTEQWQKYTFLFESDGKTVLVPHFGVINGEAWFDRFMINSADKPQNWENSSIPYARVIFPDPDKQIFEFGKSLPITLELNAFHLKNKKSAKPLNIVISNHFGKSILKKTVPIIFDNKGKFLHRLVIPGKESGWFRITAGVDGLLTIRDAVVIARSAKPLLRDSVSSFMGLFAAERMPEVYKRLGIKWLDLSLDWRHVEAKEGKYDFSSGELLKKYKNMGFKINLCISTGAPAWVFPKAVVAAAKKMGTHSHGLMMSQKITDTKWKKVLNEFLSRYSQYVDIFEIGGEVDAMVGLASYNKSLEPDKKIANFAAGRILDRLCYWINATASTVRNYQPNAYISAVRPSDVDARYHYAYSRAVFERCGKWVNLFGIDCYPQPRWIGPEAPPTGTEQQLKQRFTDAKNAMKGVCNGNDVAISEYGYFVDANEIFNPEYLLIQVNRMSRSFLQAKLLGMKRLSYFHGGRVGLEGNRYHMGLQFGSIPFPAIAALPVIADTVNGVIECEEIMINSRLGGGVFKHLDNSCSAAIWAINDGYTPELEISGSDAKYFDIMGNSLPVKKLGSKIILPISTLPVFIRSNNYDRLHTIIKSSKIINDTPLDILIRPENLKNMRFHLKNNTLENITGTLFYPTGNRNFKLAPQANGNLLIPVSPPEKKQEYKLNIVGKTDSVKIVYCRQKPALISRNDHCYLDGSLTSWQGIKPLFIGGHERIMPLDHTTYSGLDDLSGKIYLAHNGKTLFITVEVKDDHIHKGDSVELGFDPLNNHLRLVNGSDYDDIFVSLFTDGHFKIRGRRASVIEKVSKFKVVKNLKNNLIIYQFSVPLDSLHERLCRAGNIFGFNVAICDDDSGAGADYWLELRPGLLGSLRPDLFQEVAIK